MRDMCIGLFIGAAVLVVLTLMAENKTPTLQSVFVAIEQQKAGYQMWVQIRQARQTLTEYQRGNHEANRTE